MDKKNKFCRLPWTRFDVKDKKVSICCWKGTGDIGNPNLDNLYENWNSTHAQNLRKSILSGEFNLCKENKCHLLPRLVTVEQAKKKEFFKDIIDNNKIILNTSPIEVSHSADPSCNLWCPSCRTTKIVKNNNRHFVNKIKTDLNNIVENFKDLEILNIAGFGDPFAAASYREWLQEIDIEKYPKLTFNIRTNGVSLTPKRWEKISKIHNKIVELGISIDGATPATYEQLRLGGNWKTLWKNIDFLAKEKDKFPNLQLRMDVVVQQKNFLEIPIFAQKCYDYGFEGLKLEAIQNFGHWSSDYFNEQKVWDPKHKDFSSLKDIMQNEKLIRVPLLKTRITEFINSKFVKWPLYNPENDILYKTKNDINLLLKLNSNKNLNYVYEEIKKRSYTKNLAKYLYTVLKEKNQI